MKVGKEAVYLCDRRLTALMFARRDQNASSCDRADPISCCDSRLCLPPNPHFYFPTLTSTKLHRAYEVLNRASSLSIWSYDLKFDHLSLTLLGFILWDKIAKTNARRLALNSDGGIQ